MTLAQVIILTAIGGIAAAAVDFALSQTGGNGQLTRLLLVFPVAIFAAVLLAWPIARLFGIGPLMVLSGRCPGCGQRPHAWGVLEKDANHLRLACSNCSQLVELWLSTTPPSVHSETLPRYRLRWPKFLGLWKKVGANVA